MERRYFNYHDFSSFQVLRQALKDYTKINPNTHILKKPFNGHNFYHRWQMILHRFNSLNTPWNPTEYHSTNVKYPNHESAALSLSLSLSLSAFYVRGAWFRACKSYFKECKNKQNVKFSFIWDPFLFWFGYISDVE